MNTTPSPAIEAVELPEPVAHRFNTMEGFEPKVVWHYEGNPARDSAFTFHPLFSKEQVLALLAAKQEEVDKMRADAKRNADAFAGLQASAAAVEPVAGLRKAMDSANIPPEYRAPLIGYFCNELKAAPPLPAQVQEAEPVMHLRQFGDVTSAQMDEYLQTGTIAGRCADPMDTPLPCDVVVGHVTIRKGVALRALVARTQTLYDMAHPTGGNASIETMRLGGRFEPKLSPEAQAFSDQLDRAAAPHPSPAPQAAGAEPISPEEWAEFKEWLKQKQSAITASGRDAS